MEYSIIFVIAFNSYSEVKETQLKQEMKSAMVWAQILTEFIMEVIFGCRSFCVEKLVVATIPAVGHLVQDRELLSAVNLVYAWWQVWLSRVYIARHITGHVPGFWHFSWLAVTAHCQLFLPVCFAVITACHNTLGHISVSLINLLQPFRN